MKKVQKIRVFRVRQLALSKVLKNKGFIPWNSPFFSCNLSDFSVYYKNNNKKERLYIMTIQQIYEKFATLQTSSDKLVFIDELKTLTENKVINFDLNFSSIEEEIMNEA